MFDWIPFHVKFITVRLKEGMRGKSGFPFSHYIDFGELGSHAIMQLKSGAAGAAGAAGGWLVVWLNSVFNFRIRANFQGSSNIKHTLNVFPQQIKDVVKEKGT